MVVSGEVHPLTPTEKAVAAVESMRIGPRHRAPLVAVRCHLAGNRATCTGRGSEGTFVATQVFTIEPNGSLVPWCPRGSRKPSIFCAS
jgi:hypothetical protein